MLPLRDAAIDPGGGPPDAGSVPQQIFTPASPAERSGASAKEASRKREAPTEAEQELKCEAAKVRRKGGGPRCEPFVSASCVVMALLPPASAVRQPGQSSS